MIKAAAWEKVFIFFFYVGFLINEGDSGVTLKKKRRNREYTLLPRKKKEFSNESMKCAEVKQKPRLKY